MPKLPKLPDLPDPEKAFSAIDKAGSVLGKGLEIIDQTAGRIDRFAVRIDPLSRYRSREIATEESTAEETPAEEAPAEEASAGVSNEATLKYQLDLIIDDIEHLETEHLPGQGRLNGEACDCIAKASRSLRRHAKETIPIASRQGVDATIFSGMWSWAQHLMDIGTINQVLSGNYDTEYLEQAGTASNYRKQAERMLSEIGVSTGESCPTCEEARESIRQFIAQRKNIRGE
jgi:hypothetical protein